MCGTSPLHMEYGGNVCDSSLCCLLVHSYDTMERTCMKGVKFTKHTEFLEYIVKKKGLQNLPVHVEKKRSSKIEQIGGETSTGNTDKVSERASIVECRKILRAMIVQVM